jgi:hypothetical protein
MKSLLLTLIVAFSTQAFAAVELGKYIAKDKEEGTTVAKFELRADKSVTFSVSNPSLPTPISCTGKWEATDKSFSAALNCDSELLPEAAVTIDISNVTAAGLRSASGVQVGVVIDALGEEAQQFMLKKAD